MPRFAPGRVMAARRLEHARQLVRELARYGRTVTPQDTQAVRDAERDYDLATALLRP